MVVAIRPAAAADGPVLQRLEVRAGEAFRSVGLASVADDAPPALDVLAAYAAAGRAWVAATTPHDEPVGYVLVDVVDGAAHVEQVSVDPDRQGTGIGRVLLDHVERWARSHDLGRLTLTTFAAVPWNAPLYDHLGFRVLTADEVGPGLRARVEAEQAHGLDPEQRVCMARGLVPGPGRG